MVALHSINIIFKQLVRLYAPPAHHGVDMHLSNGGLHDIDMEAANDYILEWFVSWNCCSVANIVTSCLMSLLKLMMMMIMQFCSKSIYARPSQTHIGPNSDVTPPCQISPDT